ncbi:Pc21g16020 protein [Trichuris trichiura]|uniref:Pc21g16020 protein n=1 Tax=Trichuris trichiura TaxID=36087 RepID=A0A077ZI99_TRITR|nr:Pc21g16020 protein [Trichuris trichiura]
MFTFDQSTCNRNRQYPIPYQERHNGYKQVHNTFPRWPYPVVNKFIQKQPERIHYHFGIEDKLKEHQVVLEVTDEFLFKRSKPPICVIHELEHHLCISVGLDCRCNFDKSFPKQQTIQMHITGNNVTASTVATARNKREAKHIAACLMLNGLINSNLIQVFGTKEFIEQNSRTKLLYASDVFLRRKPNSAIDLEKLLKKRQTKEPTALNPRIPRWQYSQPTADQQTYSTRQNNNGYVRPYQPNDDAQRLVAQRQSDYEKRANTGHECAHSYSNTYFQMPTVDPPKKATSSQVQRQPQTEAVQTASQPRDDAEKAIKPSTAKITPETGESDNEEGTKEQLILYRKPKLPPSPSKKTVYKRKKNEQDKQTKPKAADQL